MSLTAYITSTPLDSGFFKDIYSSLREFKSRFKERFELDHYMGGVVDDTDPTCEGYHKKLTMNGGEYNASNIPATIPACPTGGIVFFSIGGELCCYDGNTAKQITDDGEIDYSTDTDNNATINSYNGYSYCEGNGIVLVYYGATSTVYKVEGETYIPVLISGATKFLYFCNDKFYVSGGGYLYESSDGEVWTLITLVAGSGKSIRGMGYANGHYILYVTYSGGYNYIETATTDLTTYETQFNLSDITLGDAKAYYIDSKYVFISAYEMYISTDLSSWTRDTTNYLTAYAQHRSNEYIDGWPIFEWDGDLCWIEQVKTGSVYSFNFARTSDCETFTKVNFTPPSWGSSNTWYYYCGKFGFVNGVYYFMVSMSGVYTSRVYYSSNKTDWSYVDFDGAFDAYTYPLFIHNGVDFILYKSSGTAATLGYYSTKDFITFNRFNPIPRDSRFYYKDDMRIIGIYNVGGYRDIINNYTILE